MPTTTYDLIDTALKIGLGGVVGAAATLLSTSMKNRHDLKVSNAAREHETKSNELSRDHHLAISEEARKHELRQADRANSRRLLESALANIDPFLRIHHDFLLHIGRTAGAFEVLRERGETIGPEVIKKHRNALMDFAAVDGTYAERFHLAHGQAANLILGQADEAAEKMVEMLTLSTHSRDRLLKANDSTYMPSRDEVKGEFDAFFKAQKALVGSIRSAYHAMA